MWLQPSKVYREYRLLFSGLGPLWRLLHYVTIACVGSVGCQDKKAL